VHLAKEIRMRLLQVADNRMMIRLKLCGLRLVASNYPTVFTRCQVLRLLSLHIELPKCILSLGDLGTDHIQAIGKAGDLVVADLDFLLQSRLKLGKALIRPHRTFRINDFFED
jgi:hypothetical protein